MRRKKQLKMKYVKVIIETKMHGGAKDMNAYEATKRIYAISDELTILSNELGATRKETERSLIEQKINILENEFFSIKHKLEKISIPVGTL